MKRVFWVALGAAAGVLIARRLTRVVAEMGPESLGNRLVEASANLAAGVREFADAVRDAAAEREKELRDALGINSDEAAHGADLAAVERLVNTNNRRDIR